MVNEAKLDLDFARESIVQLLLAYAKSDEMFGADGIEWDDVDEAFALAKEALPGMYESIVSELKSQQLDDEQEALYEKRLREEGR
jgi:hypothetical protein